MQFYIGLMSDHDDLLSLGILKISVSLKPEYNQEFLHYNLTVSALRRTDLLLLQIFKEANISELFNPVRKGNKNNLLFQHSLRKLL